MAVTYTDNDAVDTSDIDSGDIRVSGLNRTFRPDVTLVRIDNAQDGETRVATYRFEARGGDWDIEDNGLYSIYQNSNEVSDINNNFAAPNRLGIFKVNIVDPSPTASAYATDVTTAGGATHTFTVTYSDNSGIDASTIGNSDVRVAGPYGYSAPASLVRVDSRLDGTPRVATYRIGARYGSWDRGDNGRYVIRMNGGQVQDINGNAVPSGTIGSFRVNISANPVDVIRPTARVFGRNPFSGDSVYSFNVSYSDNVSIDVSSIDSNDIRVNSPRYSGLPVTLVRVSSNTDGSPRTATYRINAPGGSGATFGPPHAANRQQPED